MEDGYCYGTERDAIYPLADALLERMFVGERLDDLRYVDSWWLVPLGLPGPDFLSADYFPLLPNFGFFLLGAAIGRTVYRNKESLLPRVNANAIPLRFLQWWGKQSLFIYLAHQPILTGLCILLSALM